MSRSPRFLSAWQIAKAASAFLTIESALLGKLISNGKPVIVASFGSPYLVERFPAAQTWLAAFSTVDVAQSAMGRALFGETPIGGHLPVSIPGANPPLRIGDGMKSPANPMTLVNAPAARDAQLSAAYALLQKAVSDHAFPGGVLAVGVDNRSFISRVRSSHLRTEFSRGHPHNDLRFGFAHKASRHRNPRRARSGSWQTKTRRADQRFSSRME